MLKPDYMLERGQVVKTLEDLETKDGETLRQGSLGQVLSTGSVVGGVNEGWAILQFSGLDHNLWVSPAQMIKFQVYRATNDDEMASVREARKKLVDHEQEAAYRDLIEKLYMEVDRERLDADHPNSVIKLLEKHYGNLQELFMRVCANYGKDPQDFQLPPVKADELNEIMEPDVPSHDLFGLKVMFRDDSKSELIETILVKRPFGLQFQKDPTGKRLKVREVTEGQHAHELGIEPGWILESIEGEEATAEGFGQGRVKAKYLQLPFVSVDSSQSAKPARRVGPIVL